MNDMEKEQKLVAKIDILQKRIEDYKKQISQAQKEIDILELAPCNDTSIREDLIGHNFYIITISKKKIEKCNKKIDKLFNKLNEVTLRIYNASK